MNILFFLCMVGTVSALPKTTNRLGNPDEWGEHFQGDIMLPLPGMKRNGIINEKYRWPDGVVAYMFSKDFPDSNKQTVLDAMQLYRQRTNACIKFVERTNEKDYILYTSDDDDGCFSSVGRIGGRQLINYPQWCIDSYGSVQHEMYHALGFFHEQSRTDRDEFVTILWDNIEPGYESNFESYDANTITAFGYPYDYMSLMHYSQFAFSKNGKRTIKTTDQDYQFKIGQRDGLSSTDLNKLMAMYKCSANRNEQTLVLFCFLVVLKFMF